MLDEQFEHMVNSLPQTFPFRFVDQVIAFRAGSKLLSRFTPGQLPTFMRGTPDFPPACVIEGLAQATVLLVMLETGPFAPGDIPLLGSVQFELTRAPGWDEIIHYEIRPERLTRALGIVSARAWGTRGPIATGTVGVAKRMATAGYES